ncbi:hypothetical protein FK85_27400 [Halorubrum saccharovorum]|uniref:Uncharacterized protein n=1 Tax=Halorubrum saccharovorum TaxID=2248 RepID=A0A0F8D5J6_9EURY|nr:hypothetical protein FK85_27400 [Halorubrum saccharovorum]
MLVVTASNSPRRPARISVLGTSSGTAQFERRPYRPRSLTSRTASSAPSRRVTSASKAPDDGVPDDVVRGLDAAGVERVRRVSGEWDLGACRGVHVSLAVRDVPVVRYLDAARLQLARDDLRGIRRVLDVDEGPEQVEGDCHSIGTTAKTGLNLSIGAVDAGFRGPRSTCQSIGAT